MRYRIGVMISARPLVLLLVIGCAAENAAVEQPPPTKPNFVRSDVGPEFLDRSKMEIVYRGSGVFATVFRGVGSSNGIRNLKLLRVTAANRARSEIMKSLETFVASMFKDYGCATIPTDQPLTPEQQAMDDTYRRIAKLVSARSVEATEIVADGTVIAGAYGTLTIDRDGSYTYVLNVEADHQADPTPTDEFAIKVVDATGDEDSDTLVISIVDDAPVESTPTPAPPVVVHRPADHSVRGRVEHIRKVSSVMIDQAAYDPSLRFLLVAAAFFILFIVLLIASKVIG